MVGEGVAWNWLFRWPPGVVLAGLRYFLDPLPVYRVDEDETVVLPELPEEGSSGLQVPENGTGAVFHRNYRVRIRASPLRPEQLMDRLRSDPNEAVPLEVALFDGVRDDGGLQAGDELTVRMPGPWDGPVRVLHVSATSFRLATLPGHPEAGQIEFRASGEDEELVFEIESWACSGDRLANLLYDGVTVFKQMQAYLWTHYCVQVCALSGGQLDDGVDVHTGRAPSPQKRTGAAGGRSRSGTIAASRPSVRSWRR